MIYYCSTKTTPMLCRTIFSEMTFFHFFSQTIEFERVIYVRVERLQTSIVNIENKSELMCDIFVLLSKIVTFFFSVAYTSLFVPYFIQYVLYSPVQYSSLQYSPLQYSQLQYIPSIKGMHFNSIVSFSKKTYL
jgi:hypothetical protein